MTLPIDEEPRDIRLTLTYRREQAYLLQSVLDALNVGAVDFVRKAVDNEMLRLGVKDWAVTKIQYKPFIPENL